MRIHATTALKYLSLAALAGLLAVGGLRLLERPEEGPHDRLGSAERLYLQAIRGGDPDLLRRSASQYQQLIKQNPGHADAHFGLGRCQLALGQLKAAEETSFRAVKLAQAINNVFAVQRAKNNLGKVYVAQGRYEKARDLFKHAILRKNRFHYHRTDGTHWGCAYQGLGELYSTLEREPQAAVAVTVDEGDHESLFNASLAHYDNGNTDLALGYIDRAMGLSSRSRYKVLKGFLLLQLKKYDQARSLFLEARKTRPRVPGPEAGLGHLGIIRKDYSEARRHLQACLDAWPLSGAGDAPHAKYYRLVHKMTLMGLGWIAANQNQHAAAIKRFEQILAMEPDDLMGLLGKGNSLLGMGQVHKAEEVFKRVLKGHPGNRYALAELAVIRMSKGADDEAEKGFRKALEQDGQQYTCPYEGLGLLYLRQGKIARAKENLRQAIRINPNIEYKKFNALAKIYISEGRHDQAVTLLKKSIENYPHDPEAASLLLQIERLRGGAGSRPKPAASPPAIGQERPAPGRFTAVSLGLWVPVDLVVTFARAERFNYNDHEVEVEGGVVKVDGRPAGLDLLGLSLEEAARLLAAHPQAASSVRVAARVLCQQQVLSALNGAGSPALSVTLPDAYSEDTDLSCLASLEAPELFLHIDQAGDRPLRALAALRNLRELKLGGLKLGDRGLAHLAGLAGLRVLVLADTSITDRGLAHLSRLAGLHRLNLWGTSITDAGLAHLAGLTGLRRLELGDTAVSDQGLVHLARLKHLNTLGLGSTRVAGPGLAHLSSLRLTSLELWYTNLNDAGLAHLARMKSLQDLQIWYTRVTDRGLAHLPHLSHLRRLGLGGTVIGDEGLAHLARLKKLRMLDIWGTRVTDIGVAHLKELKSLEDLSLGGTAVSDAGLKNLAGLSSLRRLSLWGTRVTDAGMDHLGRMAALEELELFATRVGDRGISHLSRHPRLRFVELSDTRVTNSGLEQLAKLTSLRELELGGTPISDAGLAHLAGLPRLRELGLANNQRVTDAGLAHLSGMTGLRELVLGNTGISDRGLRHLASLRALELLELGGTRVSDPGLAHLAGLARLSYLGLGATAVMGQGLSHLKKLHRLRELELWHTAITDLLLVHLPAFPSLSELELSGTRITDKGLIHLEKIKGLRLLEHGMTHITLRGITQLQQVLPALSASELASF